jgi:2'-5' RNA ligase
MEDGSDEELRCFIATFVSAESAATLAGRLRLPPGVRPVDPAAWHVTLRFLGSVPPAALPELLTVVADLHGHPLEVIVTGFVGLPRWAAARVIAGAIAEDAGLRAWAEQVAACVHVRFGPGDHAFRPHVTVARSRRPIRFRAQALAAPVAIRLEPPGLYRSRVGQDGARYERVVDVDTGTTQ